jgi:hypothetical protein
VKSAVASMAGVETRRVILAPAGRRSPARVRVSGFCPARGMADAGAQGVGKHPSSLPPAPSHGRGPLAHRLVPRAFGPFRGDPRVRPEASPRLSGTFCTAVRTALMYSRPDVADIRAHNRKQTMRPQKYRASHGYAAAVPVPAGTYPSTARTADGWIPAFAMELVPPGLYPRRGPGRQHDEAVDTRANLECAGF